MTIDADLQALESDAFVTLYEVDAAEQGAEVYRFHSYRHVGPVIWQGLQYDPWPVEASGFEMKGGSSPTPRLRLGNVGGFLTALVLGFDDLVGARVTRRRTMAKYLDGRPDADPDQHLPDDVWFIEQRTSETAEAMEFELSSALDFNGVELPRRQIIANNCPWRYRSTECGYTGPPVADEYDIITTDAAKDKCGKRLQSCKLRFGANNPLPFGGFPAAGLVR